MAKKESVKSKETKKDDLTKASANVLDISSFFTTSREIEGVWYEPKIDGYGIGIEFKILGPASGKAIEAAAEYVKEYGSLNQEMDIVEQNKKLRELEVNRISPCVIDIRGVNGSALSYKGKPLVYSDKLIRELCYESSFFREKLFEAVSTSTAFLDFD